MLAAPKSKILLSLNSIPKSFEYSKQTKLVEISQSIQKQYSNIGIQNIKFNAPDGATISKVSTMSNLQCFPYISMTLRFANNLTQEYNILTKGKAHIPMEHKGEYDELVQNGMNKKKARELG